MPRSVSSTASTAGKIVLFAGAAALTWASAAVGLTSAARLVREFRAGRQLQQVTLESPAAPDEDPAGLDAAESGDAHASMDVAAHDDGEYDIVACHDQRYQAIRRAAMAYCRDHRNEGHDRWLCPDVMQVFGSCRRYPDLTLQASPECHRSSNDISRTICHDDIAFLRDVDEIVPILALTRSTGGRWKVVEIEFDDLERP